MEFICSFTAVGHVVEQAHAAHTNYVLMRTQSGRGI